MGRLKEASIGRVVVKLEGVYSSGKNDFTNGGGGWKKMCAVRRSACSVWLRRAPVANRVRALHPSFISSVREFGSGLESPCFASGAGEGAHIQ